MNFGNAFLWQTIMLYVLAIWSVVWKGIALWKSVKFNQRNWFIVILVLNGLTFGILEIVYLFWFAKKRMTFESIENWIRSLYDKSK